MLSKFAAERPVTNFFLFWVLTILLAPLGEVHNETSPIISFFARTFYFLYYIWYPLSIYHYILHKDMSLKHYMEKNYPKIQFGKWLIVFSLLISGLSFASQGNENLEKNTLFVIFVLLIGFSWWFVYARLCWRTSKLLEKQFNVKMGIRPYDGYQSTPPHELTFFLLLTWPFPGIFHVGDRILPVLRRERKQRAAG